MTYLALEKMNMIDLVDRIIVINFGEKVLDGPKDEVIKQLNGSAK